MKTLLKYFIRGAVIAIPVAASLYVVYWAVGLLDDILNFTFTSEGPDGRPVEHRIPGVGLVILLGSITLIGFLASNVFFRNFVVLTDGFFKRVPLVKLLYTSTKDFVTAFTGQRKTFDKPAVVSLSPDGSMLALGFVTREALTFRGLEGMVAVYFPQAYNFAGNVLVFPRDRVRLLDIPSAEVMAFVVSGGVSGAKSAADTILPVDMSKY